MQLVHIVWIGLALIYGAFFIWYTNLSGPMKPQEVEAAIEKFTAMGATPERLAMLRGFMEQDDGRNIIMLNLLDMAETPVSVRGETLSSDDAMARYMEHMWPALIKRACHPVLFGKVVAPAMDRAGIEGADDWRVTGLMRYRSRRDLIAIASDPSFHEVHDYKLAALERTLAFPMRPGPYLGDPRLVLALMLLAIAGIWPRG